MRQSIELARVKDSSTEVFENWFKVFHQAIEDENVPWGNVYNCDESGFGIGKKRATRVIVDASLKKVYQVETSRQE
jgi:hypothetical protein